MIIGCQAFYAEHFFKNIQEMKPRTIIITSGTLTPFSEIESELNMTFPIKLVNNHVIERRNIFMSVLKKGRSGNYLNLSHGNMTKNTTKLSEDLGLAVNKIVKEVKSGGVLVFF
jgi:regulator of telomere elongation helicase 1